MSLAAKSIPYRHVCEPVMVDRTFPHTYDLRLISDMVELREALDRCDSSIAFDTETSGLNPEWAKLVGFSFCYEKKIAYYVPVYHATGISLGKRALDLFYQKLLDLSSKGKSVFVFNLKFDFRFMEYAGYDMSKILYYDAQTGIWLADTNVPFPSLKKEAVRHLGWNMPTFAETLGDFENFFYLDPLVAYSYAATDALATYALAPIAMKYSREARLSGVTDNKFLYPLMKIEENKHLVDKDLLRVMKTKAHERVSTLCIEVERFLGYPINLGSPDQVSRALNSFGLDTGVHGKNGAISSKADLIESLYLKTEHPFLRLIVDYRKAQKQLSSYIEPLLEFPEDGGRFCYHSLRAPTSRLASGKDAKNDFYQPYNVQSTPKPSPKDWYVHEDTTPKYESDVVVLDWRFSIEDPSEYTVEGFDPEGNVRRAFLPNPPGEDPDLYYWLSNDFSGEELRLAADYSGETLWINAFNNNEDLHKLVAVKMFGEASYDKKKRGRAKVLNFCETSENFLLTDRGYMRAREIETNPNVKLTSKKGDPLDWELSTKDSQSCLDIVFSNGVAARYHERHKLQVWNPEKSSIVWKEVKDIELSDQLISMIPEAVQGEFVPDFYLAGVYLLGEERKGNGRISLHVPSPYVQKMRTAFDSILDGCSPLENLDGLLMFNNRLDSRFCDSEVGTIPEFVYRGSVSHRASLLAGMLDFGGRVNQEKKLVFLHSDRSLANYVALLCHSLGIKTVFIEGKFEESPEHKLIALSPSEGESASIFGVFLDSTGGVELPLVILKDTYDKEARTKRGFRIDPMMFLGGMGSAGLPSRPIPFPKLPEGVRLPPDFKAGEEEFSPLSLDAEGVSGRIPLTKNMYPVSIIRKKPVIDTIYAFEVPGHIYQSSSVVSHNSQIYGASVQSTAAKFNMTLEEAQEFVDTYWRVLPILKGWIERVQRFGARNGTVQNYFGRPRRVKRYFENIKQKAFGRRTCVNTIIQSTGADLIKMSIIRLWNRIWSKLEFKKIAVFKSTIHDEVNQGVLKTRLTEIARATCDAMEIKVKDWPVQMEVGVEIGTSWGCTFPFQWEGERLVPSMKKKTIEPEVENIPFKEEEIDTTDLVPENLSPF